MTLEHKILGQTTVDSTTVVPTPRFVSVGYFTDTANYSTDGLTWSQATMPSNEPWTGMARGDDKFVVVTYAGELPPTYTSAYSTDGITWVGSTSLSTSSTWEEVAYGNNRYVAVGNGDFLGLSYDGITWSDIQYDGFASGLAFGNGMFVYTMDMSNNSAYSTDGIVWTTATNPYKSYSQTIYGSDKFVSIAYGNTSSYSTDGISWTDMLMPSFADWQSVAYGNGKFVAVASSNATAAAYSTDGISWTASTLPSFGYWNRITYGDNIFVATSYFDNQTSAVSTDGITWESAGTYLGINFGDKNLSYAVVDDIQYTTTQTVYTVPANTEALVSSIYISNTADTDDTYNFAVVPNGETLSDVHQIRKNATISAGDFHNIDTKITMSAGDSLVALSGAADKLNITVFGVEKS